MIITYVVILSIVIQLIAASLALRLIKVTGHLFSWTLIAIAMTLQASRRIFTLYGILTGVVLTSQGILAEWIGLAVSCLMLIGVSSFGSFLKESEKSIREKKKAQDQLSALKLNFNNLFEEGPFGMVLNTSDFRFIKVNSYFANMMGYSADELLKLSFKDVTHPEDFKQDSWNIKQLINREISVYKTEKRYIRKNGQEIWGSLTVTANFDAEENFLYNIGIIEDITQRKNTEEQLRKSKKLLSETESIGRVGGWEFNLDTLEQTWTEEVYRIHEVDFSFNPNVNQGISFYTPASRPIVEKAVQKVMETGEPFDLELEIITAKGNLRKVHTIGKADNENRRVYGFFQDITERKLVEEQLQQSEQSFSAMFNLGPVAKSLAKASDMKICNFSKAAEHLFEIKREDIIGKPITSIDFWVSLEDRLAVRDLLFKNGFVHGFEFQYKTMTGKTGWASGYSESIEINNEKYFYTEYVDITERKKAEEKIRELSERIAAATKAAQVGIWEWDILNNKLIWDDQMYALYGLKKEDVNDTY